MIDLRKRATLRTLAVASAAPLAAGLPRFAHAADFSMKYGHNLPVTHPLHIRAAKSGQHPDRRYS